MDSLSSVCRIGAEGNCKDARPRRGAGLEQASYASTGATTHCEAGCTLGDVIAEWVVFGLGVTLAGRALWPEYIGDFALAYLLGIVFQFFAIVPMRHLTVGAGIREAVKADTLSLTAFEVGLFAWMALMAFVIFQPAMHPDSVVYWFMMQIGMIIGFATSYPMNWVLVRRGVKEGM